MESRIAALGSVPAALSVAAGANSGHHRGNWKDLLATTIARDALPAAHNGKAVIPGSDSDVGSAPGSRVPSGKSANPRRSCGNNDASTSMPPVVFVVSMQPAGMSPAPAVEIQTHSHASADAVVPGSLTASMELREDVSPGTLASGDAVSPNGAARIHPSAPAPVSRVNLQDAGSDPLTVSTAKPEQSGNGTIETTGRASETGNAPVARQDSRFQTAEGISRAGLNAGEGAISDSSAFLTPRSAEATPAEAIPRSSDQFAQTADRFASAAAPLSGSTADGVLRARPQSGKSPDALKTTSPRPSHADSASLIGDDALSFVPASAATAAPSESHSGAVPNRARRLEGHAVSLRTDPTISPHGLNLAVEAHSLPTPSANLPSAGSSAPLPKAPASGQPILQETFAALDNATAHPATTWVHAGQHHAEAGYLDPALGWISVRANAAGNTLHAAIVPGSTEAAQTLGGHIAGLTSYLAEQHMPAAQITLASPHGSHVSSGFGQTGQGSSQGQANQGSADDPAAGSLLPRSPGSSSGPGASRVGPQSHGPAHIIPADSHAGIYISVKA